VAYHAATSLTSRRVANRLAQRLLAPVIQRDLARLAMDAPVLIAGLPHAVDILPWLPRRALVYHCADDYANAAGFPASLPELEADLCRAADRVITTSDTLCHDRRRFNPNTHWVPNGVDFEHFSRPAKPADELNGMTHPVIGFVGGLSEWVDLDLVALAARERPNWSFVLVGPIAIDTSVVRFLHNVRLLGARPYSVLPEYLAGMSVALIPFKRTTLTYHADPIKAYEYLAAGLPVVATELPALRRLAHVVRLADSPEVFLSQLDAAVAEGRDQQRAERQAEAAQHSWRTRFARIEELLCETVREPATTCAC
jgi:glycosyltransferase involved in cell wall biosynthesis